VTTAPHQSLAAASGYLRRAIAFEQPVQSAIRHIIANNPAFTQQPFADKSEPFEKTRRGYIARVDIRVNSAQVQRAKCVLDQRGGGLTHIATAPMITLRTKAYFCTSALLVGMKESAVPEDFACGPQFERTNKILAVSGCPQFTRDAISRLIKQVIGRNGK
jgi:hypothetical protein